ncbi:ABC transporter permease [Thermotoga profunda]|uniref:ABC transporter permease n=1 Tax=Thermotoga profunda TaxID=1508420 RepID=UPI0006933681|nr:ABC transporter permease [Thermotoga profunda]
MQQKNSNQVLPKGKRPVYKNQWFFLLLAEVVLAAITGTINPRFFSLSNITNILEQIAVLGILASGMTMLIISGEIDISVGANIGLVTCVIAMMIKNDVSYFWVIVVALALASFDSLLVGSSSLVFRAPSFITSLGFLSVFRGTAYAITKGVFQTIYGKFEALGLTRIWGILPLGFLIGISIYFLVHFILKYSKLGRHFYAVGSNPAAAYLSGISIFKTKMLAFLANGLLVGLASMILLSRVGAAQPTTGSGLELRAIGAVVIGGTPLSGGKGNILGTFFGVLLMGIISNTLNMLRVNPYFQEVVFGIFIVASLAVSAFSAYAGKGIFKKSVKQSKEG